MGIWSPNRAEWVILQFATARIGAVLVNINPAYRAHELAYALEQSGVSLLLLARNSRQTDYLALLAEVRPRLPRLREAIVLDTDWDTLRRDGDTVSESDLAARARSLQFDDPINIQYTSGTTGFPKGPIEVMRRVQKELHMPEVTICYGMTETSPVSTQSSLDDPLDKRVGTVGRVHPHLEIKIVDPATGAIVPRGQPGELCTRGYSVMLGYWDNPEATKEAIDAARWMHTGDLATMDADGYVKIVGRIKDMVLRGGENIFPREIEEFL